MTERKLATIRKVLAVDPIPGADKIVVVTVDGWKCVVQKSDEISVGDPVVYFEIDSFLPIRPQYEFLRKGCYHLVPGLGEGFRLRTIKLRGQISQGLVIRIQDVEADLPEGWKLGDDVTESLGVVKYERPNPAQLRGQVKGNFPSFLRKTDQERVQNVGADVLRAIEDGDLFWKSLKLDGSSITIYDYNGVQGVCSRNLDLKLDDDGSIFVRMAKVSGFFDKIAGRNIAIQAELVGPGVNGNWEDLTEHRLYIFDIWDINAQEYLDYATFNWAVSTYFLVDNKTVFKAPDLGILDTTTMTSAADVVTQTLELASQTRSIKNPIAEGIVFRTTTARKHGVFSFKAISNQYLLLKHE